MMQTVRMHKQSPIAEIMNYFVSGYVYFVAFTLVLYMVSSFVTGVLGLVSGFMDLAVSPKALFAAPERAGLEQELLHTIAFTIVLVKAYTILISYAQTRHVNVKLVIEMSIIAATIEIIFNAGNYSMEVTMLFAAFAFVNLLAYLFFYKTIKTVSSDYEKSCQTLKK
jgi:uncharacterized membrane protein (DUF373 family)